LKAITLRQPHANLTAYWGKNVENRGWLPPHHIIGQWIAIHAGKRFCPEEFDAALELTMRAGIGPSPAQQMLWTKDGPYGAILAIALLGSVESYPCDFSLTLHKNPWAFGPECWMWTRIIALPEPIPCKGAQGLWTLATPITEEVWRQIGIVNAFCK
jgi:hypothetical protein